MAGTLTDFTKIHKRIPQVRSAASFAAGKHLATTTGERLVGADRNCLVIIPSARA
jgi:hypothetical protein